MSSDLQTARTSSVDLEYRRSDRIAQLEAAQSALSERVSESEERLEKAKRVISALRKENGEMEEQMEAQQTRDRTQSIQKLDAHLSVLEEREVMTREFEQEMEGVIGRKVKTLSVMMREMDVLRLVVRAQQR